MQEFLLTKSDFSPISHPCWKLDLDLFTTCNAVLYSLNVLAPSDVIWKYHARIYYCPLATAGPPYNDYTAINNAIANETDCQRKYLEKLNENANNLYLGVQLKVTCDAFQLSIPEPYYSTRIGALKEEVVTDTDFTNITVTSYSNTPGTCDETTCPSCPSGKAVSISELH